MSQHLPQILLVLFAVLGREECKRDLASTQAQRELNSELASASVRDSFANSNGQLNHAKDTSAVPHSSPPTDKTQWERSGENTVVAVLGTSKALFSFTERVGTEIAKRGFDMVTSGIGGNMDKVREAFFKAKKPTQKSIFAPTYANKDEAVENQNEKLAPAKASQQDGNYVVSEIEIADKVVALPGGTAMMKEIDLARERKKPCMGLLVPDSDTLRDGTQANQKAKDALQTNGFKWVYEKDFQKLLDWLDGKKEHENSSGAQKILYVTVSVFGIVAFGLLEVNW